MIISGKNIDVVVRPWRVWPEAMTADPRRAAFKAQWEKTTALLARELDEIGAQNIVLELNIAESQLRADGWIRSQARPYHQGAILSFTSRDTGGAVRFPCDAFDDWKDNVRAIALGLEALRKVERYGITRRHEQFAGWKALPASTEATMTVDAAAETIAKHSARYAIEIEANPRHAKEAIRSAIFATHPDRNNGDRTNFDLVETAKRVLVAHHGVTL